MNILALLFWLSVSFAAPVKSLTSSQIYNVPKSSHQAEVVIVFQPQCSSCFRQMKNLSCLDDKVNVRVMGAFASEEILRSEYLKKYSKFEGVHATHEVLTQFSVELGLAPQILVMNKGQHLVFKGLQSCQVIQTAIENLSKRPKDN